MPIWGRKKFQNRGIKILQLVSAKWLGLVFGTSGPGSLEPCRGEGLHGGSAGHWVLLGTAPGREWGQQGWVKGETCSSDLSLSSRELWIGDPHFILSRGMGQESSQLWFWLRGSSPVHTQQPAGEWVPGAWGGLWVVHSAIHCNAPPTACLLIWK
jgi:hypothetical protein